MCIDNIVTEARVQHHGERPERADPVPLYADPASANGAVHDLEEAHARAHSATKIRTQGNNKNVALNNKAAKDFKDSTEAVTQAIEVLREFYGTGAEAFVQQPEFVSNQGDSESMIITIMETAQSKFSRLLAETETSETEAAETYEILMQESAVSKAKEEASVKGKSSETKSIEKSLADTPSDLETANKELDAVMEDSLVLDRC